jgi:hypothetical protein
MRFRFLYVVFLVAGCTSPGPYATARHDQELGGRTVGAPQKCIPVRHGEQLRVADNDRHILLYGSGKTIWATHLGGLCGFFQDDQLIIDDWGGQYCGGQLVRSRDISQAEGPSCVIGDFTPYTN